MDTDRILNALGALGRWQLVNYLVLSFTLGLQACWIMLNGVFVAMEPPHHCTVPDGISLNDSIPYEENDGLSVRSKCEVYSNYTNVNGNDTITCPQGWTYDQSSFTIVHQWELVCKRSWMVELAQTILVAGVMVGALINSMLSDRFGRKKIFLINLLASTVVGCATSGVNTYIGFCVMRFLSGITQQGIIVVGFVWACEMFPAEKRTVPALLVQVFWALAMIVLAGVAYFIRNWRHLMVVVSLPGLLAIPLYWLLSESLPWLAAQHKYPELRKILERAQKWNGVKLSEDLLPENEEELAERKLGTDEQTANGAPVRKFSVANLRRQLSKVKTHEEAKAYTVKDIFLSKKLTLFAFIMVYLWCVNSLVYYGLSLSTGSLAGDPYLNFVYSGLAEILAYLIAAGALEYIGRRWPIFTFHAVAGVTMLISTAIPKTSDTARTAVVAMAMIGKFGITGSFGSIFLYAPELFPTTLRAVGIGLASVGGRVGNLSAPFSAYLARRNPLIIGGLFSGMCLLAALLTLVLPETLGRPLATTVEEVESWTRSRPNKKPKQQEPETQEMQDKSPDKK